jgi:hypothetical protein
MSAVAEAAFVGGAFREKAASMNQRCKNAIGVATAANREVPRSHSVSSVITIAGNIGFLAQHVIAAKPSP